MAEEAEREKGGKRSGEPSEFVAAAAAVEVRPSVHRKIHFLGETLTMRTTSVRGGRGGERRKAERRAVGVCGSSSSS